MTEIYLQQSMSPLYIPAGWQAVAISFNFEN